jgi:hypothetical protein
MQTQSLSERPERCRLCGSSEDLSFEHVPPRSAFNSERAEMLGLDAWLEREKGSSRRGTIMQRGSGVRTLCRRCNSRAGRLYVPELAKWTRVGRSVLSDNSAAVKDAEASREPMGIRLVIKRVYPGRFVKQVVTMLLAIAPLNLIEAHPGLASYAREPDVARLPSGVTLYLNLFLGPLARFIGTAAVMREQDHATYVVTELAYPPFAYAMVFGEPEEAPALAGCDITGYAREPIDRLANVEMLMQCGFGHTPFPLDYRSDAAILADRAS